MRKKALKTGKRRFNIALGNDARKLADRLAREDVRSFSNWLEWLIRQEWVRRFGKKRAA